jgi:subtilase family serine protease
MSKGKGLVSVLCAAVLFSGITYAITPDRIRGQVNGPKVSLRGNMHGMARPEFDLGRADGGRLIQGISLAFRPSGTQQKDLDHFIAQLGDPKSPNYHKYLTPAQFGERFGMSLNDIAKVTAWLQLQGFTNIRVANGRNQISFDGTVAQIESAFAIEMHNYAVNGVVHLANAGEPSIPAVLSGIVLGLGSLNDFAPKPRAKIQSHLTSYVSGNHFLTPADFATIYNLIPLYSAGVDGTGQKIAIVGQSTVSTTDLNNFRIGAGLPANTVTMTLQGGTATKCSGDEGESDLDIEWSGGIAKGAQIIFVYAGLGTGDTCSARNNSVWDALQYAVSNNVAPFISTSYGFCESGLPDTFKSQVQGWAQEALTHGQTIVAASGDAGAADCDSAPSATGGFQVDVPASIPEVTGAGGTEFTGDAQATVTGTAPNTTAGSNPPYWSESNTGSDAVSTALRYIPETSWNDTLQSNTGSQPNFSASGGGASTFFAKPSWQTGTGVPADGQRDVPDIAISSSNFNDPYLVCSEDGNATPCASGFRDSVGGNFFAVGGTSAAAPTFSAILALVNQYVGNTPPTGLAPVNPTLYQFPGNTPAPFHDIKSGNNKVPCSSGTTDCPSGTTQIGFAAAAGYDQVTGLGSVDAFALAEVWKRTPTSVSLSPSANTSNLGENVTFTATVTPSGASGTVNFFNNGSTTPLGSGTLSGDTVAISTAALPLGSNKITATYAGDTSFRLSSSAAAVVNTTTSFTLTPSPPVATLSVAQGQTSGAVNLIVGSTQGFVQTNGSGSTTLLPVTYSCVGLPSESSCKFSPSTPTRAIAVSLTVTTTAPTAKLQGPMDRASKIFYAVLFPGLFGILLTPLSRRRSSLRMLTLIAVLGLSTLWISSCGGTSSTKDPGTPTGSFPVTVNATTGGSAPLTSSFQFTLAVTP